MCDHELLIDTLDFSAQAYSNIFKVQLLLSSALNRPTHIGFTSLHPINAIIFPPRKCQTSEHIDENFVCSLAQEQLNAKQS